MATRNLARGESREHHRSKDRLTDARERRDAAEDRRDAATDSGEGAFEAAVALHAAEEQVAAREAWRNWIERDY